MPKDFYIDKTESKYAYREAEEEDSFLQRRTLRRRGDAKPPRKPNVPIGMAKCPICEALVPKSRLDEHMQKNHADQPDDEKTLDRCPVCDVEVRSDRLDKHLRKVHPDY